MPRQSIGEWNVNTEASRRAIRPLLKLKLHKKEKLYAIQNTLKFPPKEQTPAELPSPVAPSNERKEKRKDALPSTAFVSLLWGKQNGNMFCSKNKPKQTRMRPRRGPKSTAGVRPPHLARDGQGNRLPEEVRNCARASGKTRKRFGEQLWNADGRDRPILPSPRLE